MKIGMIGAMALTARYRTMDAAAREKLRDSRLRALVAWARECSPYFAALYKDLPRDFTLADLSPTNKTELMARFDDWVTDRDVKLADVRTFMKDLDHVGRRFRGKYLVFTTSGSTGSPLVLLTDKSAFHIMGAVNALRGVARKEDLAAMIRRGNRTIGVFATGGFYLGNGSVRALQRSMPWKKRRMGVTSALLPVPEIVKQLNRFQPAMLGGYPSNLELLIEKKRSGRLTISPALIMTGGEYLSDDLRARLSEAFECSVQTSYACTEGGTIACECRERRLHINDDWVIVEPVDRDNNPVPDGALSDKILLTNLYNFTQPIIRYEMTDRVVLHRELCACGNPSPWLTVEGRM
ncbi:MAG TPA: AMP-binding protein, partial [Clostridia bacterium]|nr:AMP-binding protein [Clostridia bacterium]